MAVKLYPERADAWYNLGIVGRCTAKSMLYTSAQCYEKALEMSPEHAITWNKLGDEGGGTVNGVLYTKVQCYEKALEMDPELQNAQIGLFEERRTLRGGLPNEHLHEAEEVLVAVGIVQDRRVVPGDLLRPPDRS